MDYLAKATMLRSQEGSYLLAHDNKKTVRLNKDGSSPNAKWVVERVEGKPNVIRLKSCFGLYLTATDGKVNWMPVLHHLCVKLKNWGDKLLQTNGEPDSGRIFNFMRWVGELLQTYSAREPTSHAPAKNWMAKLMRWVGKLLQVCSKLARPESTRHEHDEPNSGATLDGTSWYVEEAPSSGAQCEPHVRPVAYNSLASAPVSLQVDTNVNLYGLQIIQQTTMVAYSEYNSLPSTRVAFSGSHINPTAPDNSENYYPLAQYNSSPFGATQFARQIGCIGPEIYALQEMIDTTKNREQVVGFGYSGSAPWCESHSQIMSVSLEHTEKPDIFSGSDFKTWQQKMLFYLTMLNMVHLLKEDPPVLEEDEVNAVTQLKVVTWSHMDFMCRNIIMNGLSDEMYCVHSTSKTAKELWNSLERKYKPEYVGSKKFLVAKFLHFSMVDSKTVVSQVQQLQLIIQEMLTENMVIDELFQVAAIIEKLPPSWKEFKNYLMYNLKEMTVEDLIVILHIEEDNRSAAKKISLVGPSKTRINVVEGKMNNWKGKKHKESSSLGPKGGIAKKSKFTGNCFNCNKIGHRYSECTVPKRVKSYDANDVEALIQNLSYIEFKVNMDNTKPTS